MTGGRPNASVPKASSPALVWKQTICHDNLLLTLLLIVYYFNMFTVKSVYIVHSGA